METKTRNILRVCGDCFTDLRPTEYVPNTYNTGQCARCGAEGTFVYRVSKADQERDERESRRDEHEQDCGY